MTWCVVFTKPQRETLALTKLSQQGFTAYLPMHQVETIARRKRRVVWRPYFPRYLFIKQNEIFIQKQHAIKNTPGISYMIKNGELAVSVDDSIIESIQFVLDLNKHSYHEVFSEGELVKIQEGPFRNQESIFLCSNGEKRATLLMNFIMNQETKIIVDKEKIKKI